MPCNMCGNEGGHGFTSATAFICDSELDFVAEGRLELAHAVVDALEERVGEAPAASDVPDRIDPEQDVTRIAIHVGAAEIADVIVDELGWALPRRCHS